MYREKTIFVIKEEINTTCCVYLVVVANFNKTSKEEKKQEKFPLVFESPIDSDKFLETRNSKNDSEEKIYSGQTTT